MAHAIDQKVDALLRRHLLKMEAEREDDARAAMHAPEEHADAVLRRLGKIQVPEQHLPIERAAFGPERRAEQTAIWLVTRRHKTLQMMTGNQFMKNRGAREVHVVAGHTHHLLLVGHGIRWVRNLNDFAAEKKWAN